VVKVVEVVKVVKVVKVRARTGDVDISRWNNPTLG
jgi:hypothetical protein